MSKYSIHATRTMAQAFGSLLLAGGAFAQGIMSTHGTIVAADGDAVPDAGGLPIAGFTFGGSGALGDHCVLDQTGKVMFRARFVSSGGPLNNWDDRAYFYGSQRTGLKMVVRSGDPAPTLPAGVLLRTASGLSNSLTSSVRLTPDGRMLWGSNLYDGGITVTDPNDECCFGGTFGSQGVLVRQGDAAPGTVGATFAQAFASPSQQFVGMNREGRMYFQAALTGGDTTTTSGLNNQVGIWSGFPGSFELVARKGTAVSGLGGAVAIDTFTTIGAVTQMNNSGQLLYEIVLSTTQGAPAATVTNDRALMVHTPGAGSVVLVREGDVAPGTSGATFNAITGDAWVPGVATNAWTRNSETIFVTELRGGDVTAGVNDRAVYRGGVGTLSQVVRKGQAAPGTDAGFSAFNAANCLQNSNGQVAIQATLAGGTSTTANDTGIWCGLPGLLNLAVREGQLMPGAGGSIAGAFNGSAVYFNDRGQLLFNVALTGGTITGQSLWSWDPALGLKAVVLNGDQVEVNPGVFKTVNGFGGVAFSNTDGSSMHFGNDGRLGQRIAFNDSTAAIMIVAVPTGTPASFCFGDGTQLLPCPCGNNGVAGRGCDNSIATGGALLTATGSILPDTIMLSSSDELPSSLSIFLQGDTHGSFVFGDGVRCVAGNLKRLYVKTAVAGIVNAPELGDLNITTRSMTLGDTISPGQSRSYQVYYRDPSPSFCANPPGNTWNVSNGIEIFWQ